jgi:hypothetical protein
MESAATVIMTYALFGVKLYDREIKRILEEEGRSYFKVLSQHSGGRTKQNHIWKEMFRIVCVLVKI